MNNLKKLIFLMSFSCTAFAAESPEQSPFVMRGKDLGDTGASVIRPGTPTLPRKNSLQRSETIRLNLPKRASIEDKLPVVHTTTSPRDIRIDPVNILRDKSRGLSNPPVVVKK